MAQAILLIPTSTILALMKGRMTVTDAFVPADAVLLSTEYDGARRSLVMTVETDAVSDPGSDAEGNPLPPPLLPTPLTTLVRRDD